MEYEKIKQLMDDMGNSKLTSIDIDFPDGMKIRMKKEIKEVVNVNSVNTNEQVDKTSFQNTKNNKDLTVDNILKNEVSEENCNIVKSPMVGTFYLKPAPDSKPYVEIGQKVKKGDVLCIIEAMKLMNEIESEFEGEIIEILLKDGETVEYGKPLFKIK